MQETRELKLNIDHDTATRKGVISNLVMASTDGAVTRLDFINSDIPGEDGQVRAVLSSRVYMTNENLLELRDMLNDHTKNWKVGTDGKAPTE